MLDDARHFFGKEKVIQLLDMMAYYKLNKFHWHLTDSEGWRIEIKKYPKLTTIGGCGDWSRPNSREPRFYTQDDIRELVAYAADRHIEIIPEIDMPGHADASNKAYPEFSGGGFPRLPQFTFNPGREETYAYLTDILKEVAALFPSQYIHLGGDEVSFGSKSWLGIPEVQDLMKRENLNNVHEVEIHFNKRMAKAVKKLGETLIGWDEFLACELDPQDAVTMWWRHDKVNILKTSLARGYRTIMCPRRPLYFDFVQHPSHTQGRKWGGICSLEDVYNFPDSGFEIWKIPGKQLDLVIGIQANLWTDTSDSFKRLDHFTYPRLCALAESAWSAGKVKDYADFTRRMENAYHLFDSLDLYYFDPRDPQRRPELPKSKRDGKATRIREDGDKP